MLMYLNLIFSSNLNESSLGNYNFENLRKVRVISEILPSFYLVFVV